MQPQYLYVRVVSFAPDDEDNAMETICAHGPVFVCPREAKRSLYLGDEIECTSLAHALGEHICGFMVYSWNAKARKYLPIDVCSSLIDSPEDRYGSAPLLEEDALPPQSLVNAPSHRQILERQTSGVSLRLGQLCQNMRFHIVHGFMDDFEVDVSHFCLPEHCRSFIEFASITWETLDV